MNCRKHSLLSGHMFTRIPACPLPRFSSVFYGTGIPRRATKVSDGHCPVTFPLHRGQEHIFLRKGGYPFGRFIVLGPAPPMHAI